MTAHPLFLIKPASSLAGPGHAILWPRSDSGKIVYEGELGIVIGRRCRNAAPDDAAAHIFGYTVVNDVTAAELIAEAPNFPQWCRAKGFDTFGCLGPVIVTEFDWRAASVVARIDGARRQNYPLSDLIRGHRIAGQPHARIVESSGAGIQQGTRQAPVLALLFRVRAAASSAG